MKLLVILFKSITGKKGAKMYCYFQMKKKDAFIYSRSQFIKMSLMAESLKRESSSYSNHVHFFKNFFSRSSRMIMKRTNYYTYYYYGISQK